MTRKSSRYCISPTFLATLGLLWVASGSAPAKTDTVGLDTVAVADTTTAPEAVDTIAYVPSQIVSAAAEVTNAVDLEQHLHQQPTVALFKSLLVPGLGQLGNRSYFKALLFAGLETWFVASAVHYGRKADDARRISEGSDNTWVRLEYYNLYDLERKNRNKFAWFAGLTIFISMFDAYVDAHLSGSPSDPRNDEFSIDLAPADNGGLTARLTYRF